jgi:RNA polymerase sigma factor (sigma-70 family)
VVTKSVRDRLVRLAYRLLWSRDDAEDAVHDALATADEQATRLRQPEQWSSWVTRIVVSRCRDNWRRRRRGEDHLEKLALHRPSEAAPCEEAAEHAADDRAMIIEALEHLPTRQREVIVLRHLQQLGYDEIAEILEIAPATARVHAKAGLEAMRLILMQRAPRSFEDATRRRSERT